MGNEIDQKNKENTKSLILMAQILFLWKH